MKSHLWVTITLLFLSLFSVMVNAEEIENTDTIIVAEVIPIQPLPQIQEIPLTVVNENLMLVYDTCKDMGMEQHAETLQGILMQESSGGDGLFKGGKTLPSRNYGMMQIRVETARVIFRDNPDVFARYFGDRDLDKVKDSEIKHLLIYNNAASVRLAALLFKQYWELAGGDWIKTVAGYNMGIYAAIDGRNVKINPYARGVFKHIQSRIHPFNEQVGLLTESADWTKVSFTPIVSHNKGAKHGTSTKATSRIATTKPGKECSVQCGRTQKVQVLASNDHS